MVVLRLVHRLLDQQRGHRRAPARCGGRTRRVRSASSSLREDLAHHAEAVGLLGVDRVAGEHELLRLARRRTPTGARSTRRRTCPSRVPTTSAKIVPSAATMRSHAHISISAGGVHAAVHLRDGDLAQVPPAQRVLEEVVPLLQHQLLGAACARPPLIPAGGVLVRARHRPPRSSPSCRCRGPRRTCGRCRRGSRPARCRRPRPGGTPRSARRAACGAARSGPRAGSSMMRAIVPSSSVS